MKIIFILSIFLWPFFSQARIESSPRSVMLSFSEIKKLAPATRRAYLRSLAKALAVLDKKDKSQFSYLKWIVNEAHADGTYRCIGGGVPVREGRNCGAQSYAGFTCDQGLEICNPLLFGVTADKKPFCYPDATTKKCFRNIKPGHNSVLEPVFQVEGARENYNQFRSEIDSLCSHETPTIEDRVTLDQACEYIERQTQINKRRELPGYRDEVEALQEHAPTEACAVVDLFNLTSGEVLSQSLGDCVAEENTGALSSSPRPQTRPDDLNTSPPSPSGEDCQIVLSGQSINCNSTSMTQRSWTDVKKLVCMHEGSDLPFCPRNGSQSVAGLLHRIEVTADLLGLDRRHLACMTLIESRYRHEEVSSAGAAGLTQFMPSAARHHSSVIRSRYGSQWRSYQEKLGGTPFSLNSVTASNIRTGHPSYAIFAMGVYLRESIYTNNGDLSGQWSSYLRSGGDARNLFHATIGAYNWAPYRMGDMTRYATQDGHNVRDYPPLVRETDNYIRQFDQCMYSNSGWRFAGGTPSQSRQNNCFANSQASLCSGAPSGSDSRDSETQGID